MTELQKLHPEKKGWLMKWGNYMTGFQRRWFVLSNGALSYYRDSDEINHQCRGTIPLHMALINITDERYFTFGVSNGGSTSYHLKATNKEEFQSWFTAINTAKSSVIKGIESEGEEDKSVMTSSSQPEVEPEKQSWLQINMSWLGYQQYWCVLSNGVLKYYHNRIEKNPNWKLIPLQNAEISTLDFCNFRISIDGGQTNFFFKATSAEEREAWVTALKSSQAKVGGQIEKEVEKINISSSVGPESEKQGWLYKFSLWKGYVQYWCVVSNGVFKYCDNRIEQDPKWKAIGLHNAQINTVDFCDFSITFADDKGNAFFRTKSSEEREEWVNALKLSQANANGASVCENNVRKAPPQVAPNQEISAVISNLTERLENLRYCNDLNTKNGSALQYALKDLDSNDSQDITNRTKDIIENAKQFSMSSDAMIKACNEYLHTAESQDRNWLQMLQHEREQRILLEKVVAQLTNQQDESKNQGS